jgi:hypothetical protein
VTKEKSFMKLSPEHLIGHGSIEISLQGPML